MKQREGDARGQLENYIRKAREHKSNLLIAVTANVNGRTKVEDDYGIMSSIAEYYTLTEYEDIVQGIRNKGYEAKCYFEENDFIRDYLSDNFNKHRPSRLVVLNSAQKGISPGRKSLIPAFCELNQICHTNSDPYAVSFSRNKLHWHAFLSQGALPISPFWGYHYKLGWLFGKEPPKEEKIILKLNQETSSIGLTSDNILIYDTDCKDMFDHMSQKFNQALLIESFVSGMEAEVPFIISADGTSICFPPAGILLGQSKWLDDQILDYRIRGNNLFNYFDLQLEFPDLSALIMETTFKVGMHMDIVGFGRVDYRINRAGNFYITDISTNPHITKSMSFWHSFKNLGFDYGEMLESIIGLAIIKSEARSKMHGY